MMQEKNLKIMNYLFYKMRNGMKLWILLSVILILVVGCGNKHAGSIESSGTLEAVEVNIASKVAGQLLKLNVEEGSKVNVGDTIATLATSAGAGRC